MSSYYINSFLWTTIAKVLKAIVNFISIPLLIGLWGKENYGVLSLALACNGYLNILDLGMNTGAVKHYSEWKSKGCYDKIRNAVYSNNVFYLGISALNIIGLVSMALFGEHLFNLTDEEFQSLKQCLFILALFSIPQWLTTTYNQLLIAYERFAFTQKVQSIIILLQTLLIISMIQFKLNMIIYFLLLTALTASVLIPYASCCLKNKLIDRIGIAFYWNDFKPVLIYSLSIFALSIFQMTAAYSRPVILGIFGNNASDIVADYRIIEVVPLFIMMLGGTLSSIFLPKTSELLVKGNVEEIRLFAYNGTIVTTILANVLCVPFILGASTFLTLYVGHEYLYLKKWLILFCVVTLFQVHTTPGNSLILAKGKTRALVVTSAIACVLSIILNACLCKLFNVGSAVIGYALYIVIVISSYYFVYYKKLLNLEKKKMFISFFYPTSLSIVAILIVWLLSSILQIGNTVGFLWGTAVAIFCWFTVFFALLLLFKIIKLKNKHITIGY